MFIQPNWPAPRHIKAYTTLRSGGVSQKPYHSFNLALHVGDDSLHVRSNRERLKSTLNLPHAPIWIQQTHSTIAIQALPENEGLEADASYTDQMNQVCIVLTADCLPILLCNSSGTQVAAIHAGWRGLVNGIIESTLNAMQKPHETYLAWLGPAISQTHFEVGEEVRSQFLSKNPEAESAFIPSPNNRWLANLYDLARLRLQQQGIAAIYGGNYCTYSDAEQFYSYRREGDKTGRMASLIWISQ